MRCSNPIHDCGSTPCGTYRAASSAGRMSSIDSYPPRETDPRGAYRSRLSDMPEPRLDASTTPVGVSRKLKDCPPASSATVDQRQRESQFEVPTTLGRGGSHGLRCRAHCE